MPAWRERACNLRLRKKPPSPLGQCGLLTTSSGSPLASVWSAVANKGSGKSSPPVADFLRRRGRRDQHCVNAAVSVVRRVSVDERNDRRGALCDELSGKFPPVLRNALYAAHPKRGDFGAVHQQVSRAGGTELSPVEKRCSCPSGTSGFSNEPFLMRLAAAAGTLPPATSAIAQSKRSKDIRFSPPSPSQD